MTALEPFPTRAELADAATEILAVALAAQGAGAFAAAGGSTPGPVYDRLARRDLAWDRRTITLTDERWVAPDAEESNARLIRERLLVGAATRTRFLPLKGEAVSPLTAAEIAEPRVNEILPFAAVLLGMGADGHVASLFPGAPELDVGLNLDGPRLCVAVKDAGLAPFVPRISLTARALICTSLLLLLVTGDDKRALIKRIAADPGFAPPAATILRQDRCPVRVLWAR
jgi:6-phosphogluconolactonase